MERHQFRSFVFTAVSALVAIAAFALNRLNPNGLHLQSGLSWLELIGIIAGILAGHMRFGACKRLGWKKIPALIRECDKASPAAPARA